jgi:hypothetical protein
MEQKYIDRFWQNVDKTSNPNGCWEWTGGKYQFGYGAIRVGKKQKSAHRVSAELAGMSIDEKYVCHRCDNPSCVNPLHLFVGTANDNVQDMLVKGRHKGRWPMDCRPAGTQHYTSKFSEDEIREIRSLHKTGLYSYNDLAKKYNRCDKSNIWNIVNGKTYKNVV